MSLRSSLFAWSKEFRKNESGSGAVEAMLMVPLLAWCTLATLTFFDAYRSEAIAFKAGLTVADMISREANAVDDDYIDGARDLLRFLAEDDPNPDLRITAFRWNENQSKYVRVWSKERGPRSALKTSDLAGMTGILPDMTNGERAILVETWTDYNPPWEVGISSRTMSTYNVISPRFVTQICFSNTPDDTSTLKC